MSAIGEAVGSIFGGGDPVGAAREAGQIQSAAQREAVEEQRRQFELTRQQLDPFRLAGLSALNMQLALMGLPQIGGGQAGFAPTTPGPTAPTVPFGIPGQPPSDITERGPIGLLGPAIRRAALSGQPIPIGQEAAQVPGAGQPIRFGGGISPADVADRPLTQASIPQFTREEALAGLEGLPGQQFIRERQEQALLRRAAALGGLGGGQVRTALQQQAAGFAQQDLQNQLARLAALAGGGQQAAAQLGGFGQQTAAQIGTGLTGAAQARASGILGAQQAQAQQAQQGLGVLGIAAPFLLSDERLKENINDLDLKACFEAVTNMPLKSWNYFKEVGLDTDTHIGPMAQDAPKMVRVELMTYPEMIDLHDELMMIAGAIQYMKNEGMLKCH